MSCGKGKLYKSVILNLNDDNCQPNIYDCLKMAKDALTKVKSMDELQTWKIEWFGETQIQQSLYVKSLYFYLKYLLGSVNRKKPIVS